MKIIELTKKHLSIYVNNDELDVLKLFDKDSLILKRDFNDHQLLIANQLVNKDLLKRIKKDGRIIFKRTYR